MIGLVVWELNISLSDVTLQGNSIEIEVTSQNKLLPAWHSGVNDLIVAALSSPSHGRSSTTAAALKTIITKIVSSILTVYLIT